MAKICKENMEGNVEEKKIYITMKCLTVVWSFKLLQCCVYGQLDLRVVQPQLELNQDDKDQSNSKHIPIRE